MKRYKRILLIFLLLLFVTFIAVITIWFFFELNPLKKQLDTISPFDIEQIVEQSESLVISDIKSYEGCTGNEYTSYGISSFSTHYSAEVMIFSSTQEAKIELNRLCSNYNQRPFYKSFTNQNGSIIQFNYLFEFTSYFTVYKLAYVQIDNILIWCSQDDSILMSTKIGKTILEILEQSDNQGTEL